MRRLAASMPRPLPLLLLLVCVALATFALAAPATGPDDDSPIRPFRIAIPQSRLDSLRHKLAHSEFPEPYDWPESLKEAHPQGSEEEWARGSSVRYLRQLHRYWIDSLDTHNASTSAGDAAKRDGEELYDWRARERELSESLPQFTTQLDGFNLHFVHRRSSRPDALPLLFSHGWPGSFLECERIAPLLTEPPADQPAFHLVCPSIPGFAFSSAPTKPGFDVVQAAALFSRLMRRLGYERWVCQGGDWGAAICSVQADREPEHVAALHINMAFTGPPLWVAHQSLPRRLLTAASTLLDLALPAWRLEEDEQRMMAEWKEKMWDQSGYFHEQSTKPDTLGIALHDSPLGLASWLVEKYRMWSDCGGEVERRFDKQRLLDHVMLYYLTGSITSSMRFYYETLHSTKPMWQLQSELHVTVPTAFAAFPREPLRTAEKWLHPHYPALRRYTRMARGRHFAALEEPQLLVDDMRSFVAQLRSEGVFGNDARQAKEKASESASASPTSTEAADSAAAAAAAAANSRADPTAHEQKHDL